MNITRMTCMNIYGAVCHTMISLGNTGISMLAEPQVLSNHHVTLDSLDFTDFLGIASGGTDMDLSNHQNILLNKRDFDNSW